MPVAEDHHASGGLPTSPRPLFLKPAYKYRLPLEVWELIIDYHSDDVRTLLACSLTCSALLRRSRRHLYRRVVLRTEDRAAYFVRALTHDPGNWGAVHALEVEGELFSTEGTSMPLLFPMLRTLHTLVVHKLRQAAYDGARACLAAVQHSVTTLSLSGAYLRSLPALAALLTRLPHLRHLALLDVVFEEPVDEARIDEAAAPVLALDTFDFRGWAHRAGGAHIRSVLAWVCAASPGTLRSLRLQVPLGGHTSGAVHRIVAAHSATLHTLVLDLGARGFEDFEFRFGENTALRRLQLCLPATTPTTCAQLLRGLPGGGRALADLALVFRALNDSYSPAATPFARIAALRPLFAEGAFAALERLHIRCALEATPLFVTPPREALYRDLVFQDWLPEAPRDAWTDDLEETFDRVFEIWSMLRYSFGDEAPYFD
ncbi:hypothetical protein PsYK624_157590 [Phanerochaete sordida]|uniref:F-box domain-containing protein n=1 Tax=Phanerochaete sordida TaxID=48140 RepID=A0A9P3GTG9_9APHY|nr:hypothetical protein PsYK624_157590 [Phanerochaete sordida]